MENNRVFEYKLTRTRTSICMDEIAPYDVISQPAHIQSLMNKLIGDSAREHMYAFFLDTGNQIIGYELLGVGSVNAVQMSMPDLLRSFLVSGALSFVVSHNHPSGNVEPSNEDTALTQQIKRASDLIGAQFLDHVIVGGDKFYSYANTCALARMK